MTDQLNDVRPADAPAGRDGTQGKEAVPMTTGSSLAPPAICCARCGQHDAIKALSRMVDDQAQPTSIPWTVTLDGSLSGVVSYQMPPEDRTRVMLEWSAFLGADVIIDKRGDSATLTIDGLYRKVRACIVSGVPVEYLAHIPAKLPCPHPAEADPTEPAVILLHAVDMERLLYTDNGGTEWDLRRAYELPDGSRWQWTTAVTGGQLGGTVPVMRKLGATDVLAWDLIRANFAPLLLVVDEDGGPVYA